MMRYRVLLSFLGIIFLSLTISNMVYSYDDRRTHPELTKKAIRYDGCAMDDYLITYLGLPQGIKTLYGENEESMIIKLVMKGSTNEDKKSRGFNHFHNPLNDEGLDDIFTGNSNRDWALGLLPDSTPIDECGPGDHSSDHECNDYSWRRARETFYNALVSESETDRNNNFIRG